MTAIAQPPTARASRLPEFEKLLADVAARAVRVPVLAIGLAGSARYGLDADPDQDIDLVVVTEIAQPARGRSTAFGRTLDMFEESPDSLDAALDGPGRAPIVRLLSETVVLRDNRGVLQHAVDRARKLLERPAPAWAFRAERDLCEETRDCARWLGAVTGMRRTMVRGALLEKIAALALLRTGCWPAPLHRAAETVALNDFDLATRLARAIEGDDVELQGLVDVLGTPRSAADPTPAEAAPNVRTMQPVLLARLPSAAIASISSNDLRSMSKLQLLTILRVHHGSLDEWQHHALAEMLDGAPVTQQ